MGASESRFRRFVERLAGAVGHVDREEPLRAYCIGLMLPGDRKSVEPMAARVDPRRVGAMHQAMHHFVANAPWSEEAVLAAVREWALPASPRGPGWDPGLDR
jgi:SRSO17 transposase